MPETNEQLIEKTISLLEGDDKTDSSLLKVLSAHIVRLNPKSTAVSDAVREIEEIAEKRSEEPEDGHADHD
ncbi:hypothetical protein [Wenzhouxiangella sp. 15190]|nr:hypothetical protein [Wenzhouxiangella sp. 15190]